MANDLVKRMVTTDGSKRISFYLDENAGSPLDMDEFPMHCEDWSCNYTLMLPKDRETRSSDARNLIEYFLRKFGKSKKIIRLLIDNGKHMTDGQSVCDNALVYDKHTRRWSLMEYTRWYGETQFSWKEVCDYPCSKKELDAWDILEQVVDRTIDYFVERGCLTNKVKIMSYGFSYHGELSFYTSFSTDSEGIAWVEYEECINGFGIPRKYWNKEDCYDYCKAYIKEIEAWSRGEVYSFLVEKSVISVVQKHYTNVEREDETYIKEEWEVEDSCGGFYGDFDEVLSRMLEYAGWQHEEPVEQQEKVNANY